MIIAAQQQAGRWRILAPLLFILVLDVMGFGLVLPLLKPLFFDEKTSILASNTPESLRHLYYGLVLALYPIAICIGTPLLGLLSDRIGRKRVLSMSLMGAGVGLLLCAVAVGTASVALLLLGRFLTGLSSSSRSIVQAAIADISNHKTKAKNLSFIAIALTVGMVSGPLFGDLLSNPNITTQFNLTTPFVLTAVLFFLMGFLSVFFRETCHQGAKQRWNLQQNLYQCLRVFRKPKIVILSCVFVCLEFAWSLHFQTATLVMSKQYYHDSQIAGLYIAFLGLCMSLGLMLVFRVFIHYISLINTAVICAFLTTLGFFGIAMASSEYLYWVFSIPMAMGVGMTYTALLALLSNAVSKDLQGWIMGLAGALLAFSWALSGLLSSFIVAIHYSVALFISATIMLFASGLILVYKTPKPLTESQSGVFTKL